MTKKVGQGRHKGWRWSKHRRSIHLSPQFIRALRHSITHRIHKHNTHLIPYQRSESLLSILIEYTPPPTSAAPQLDSTSTYKKRTPHPQPFQSTTTTMSTPTPTTLRSLYRSLLRELPPRTSRTPSPLATHLRTTFASTSATTPTSPLTTAALADSTSTSSTIATSSGLDAAGATKTALQKVQEAEQLAAYLKAQRTYVTLVERYNHGMDMSDEERVRLSARRVGMNLPVEHHE